MGRQGRVFNVLSLVALGMTVVVLLCYVSIAVNPFLPFNPFPPDGNTFVVATVTLTSTPERAVAATWTPTVTPTVTPTPPPTFTPTVTPTPEPTMPPPTLEPTATPEPTAMPTPRVTRSLYPFTYELIYETPFYGCAWTGVAGTVEDIDGNHLIGYPIHVWGGGIDTVVYSGDKQMYGDSGWEQFFNSYPMEVSGVFKVQLHSKDNPNHPPVSEEITLDFSGFCSNALARIVFIRNH